MFAQNLDCHAPPSVTGNRVAVFDGRVIPLADEMDARAYLDTRRADGTRNAISAAAHAHLGDRAVHGISTVEREKDAR